MQGPILSGAAGTNVTATNLELSAATGIGTAVQPLATQVQRLEASGGTGGVFVTNVGDLQVGGISPSLLGLTGLLASSANIQLNVIGSLTAVEAIATSDAGQVLLTASRSIRVSGTSIIATAGAIELSANTGAVSSPGSFTGITLENATIASESGNITLHGVAGTSGHGLLLIGSDVGRTGSGDVLLAGAGAGGLADIAWDTLTLAKSGGSFTFQDTALGTQLNVQFGPYQVRFLDGGRIEQAVTFQNTGGVVLGNQDGDALTFAGGLTSTAGPTTIQGTLITEGTNILLGSTTLVSTVTLQTSDGNVTAGRVFGAGVPLTIDADDGDVMLADSQNVIGNLTVTAKKLALVENDDIMQGGAWATTGPTILRAGSHDIVLSDPANVLGPLELIGANISVVAAASMELTSALWSGNLTVQSAQGLLVTGLISGNGPAALTAGGDIAFAAGSLVDAGGGTIGLRAGGNITLSHLVTTNNTDQAVRIISLDGQICNGGSGPNIVAKGLAAVVTLQAASGAGTAVSPLQTQIAQLAAAVGSGGLFLSNAGGLNLVDIQSAGGGIVIAAGGSLTASGPVLTSEAGQIELGAAGDVTILDRIESAAGNITLRATRDVIAEPTAQISTAAGEILLLADSDGSGGGTILYEGNIDVGAGQVIFSFPDADGLLSGVIRGTGGLVKLDAGTLTIAATSQNLYTGPTDLLAGTLRGGRRDRRCSVCANAHAGRWNHAHGQRQCERADFCGGNHYLDRLVRRFAFGRRLGCGLPLCRHLAGWR